MEDLDQASPKFEDTRPRVHDPMEEVNLNTMEEPRISYISSLLLEGRDYRNTTRVQRLLCLEL